MAKVISKEETLSIHQFCIRHCVYHYDVRVELVDHLACSIETMWEENPEIPFWDALNKIYQSYGPTGFRKLMSAKEKEVAKSTQKGFKHLLLSFFYWPNIVLVFSLILFFIYSYHSFAQSNPGAALIFIFSAIIPIFIFDIYITIFSARKRKKMHYSLLILQEPSIITFGFLFQYPLISFIIDFFGDKKEVRADFTNPNIYYLYAFLIIAYLILELARWQYVKGMFKKAAKLYPQAFKTNKSLLSTF
ncbi:MAG TPA: hypothetical protein PKX92_14100 [Edaphocola sp.]|nr:hypothetical protein [Edaphocola sp.]